MQRNRGLIHAIGLAVAGLVAGAGAAQAQLVKADVGVDPTFEQTGPTTVTATAVRLSPVEATSPEEL
jgi:hypothetical protein